MSTAKKTEQVVLIKGHTHGGKAYQAGDKIAVTASQKTFLQQRNIIASDETAATEAAPSETVTEATATENTTETAIDTAAEKSGKSAKAK